MVIREISNDSGNMIEIKDEILEYFENGTKVIHIKNHLSTINRQFYFDISRMIGDNAIMSEDQSGNKTDQIYTDIKYPWHVKSNSFSHSQTRQPFHTDGAYESNPPQIVYFYCEKRAEFGGSTIFIDSDTLYDVLNIYDSGLLKDLECVKVKFEKGNDHNISEIFRNGKLTWNWYRCDKELMINTAFNNFLEHKIYEGGIYESVTLNKGDALIFIDNEVLHGRNSFVGSRWLVKGGIYNERFRNS